MMNVCTWALAAISLLAATLPALGAGGEQESPAASLTEAEARDFLDLLVLNPHELIRSGLRARKSYEAVATLAADDRPIEAVQAFERYFLNKLRNPVRYGLVAGDIMPRSVGVGGRGDFPATPFVQPFDLKKADALALGQLDGHEIGRPGQVNWLSPFSSIDQVTPVEPKGLPDPRLLLATAFTPLAQAYVVTGDEHYLHTYFAFLDDWVRHSTLTAHEPHPCLVPMELRGIQDFIHIVRTLGGLAVAIPEARQAALIPPGLIARVLGKYWNEFVLLQPVYLRTNTHNWTPGANCLLVALLCDEFKAAPILFRLGRRRSIEDNAVTQNLRDGSENQQCPWYNDNYFVGVSQVFSLLEARGRLPGTQDLGWVREVRDDPDWFQEIREHMAARIGYQLRLRSPQGSWPIGVRGIDTRSGYVGDFLLAPGAFADPENRRLRAAVTAAAQPTNVRSIVADPGVRPTYHSEWFPYSGYNLVREGWERASGYGAMFCSPQPGAYGGRRSRRNNNFFGLAAFGQDLVVEDKFDRYGTMGSPIEVDGRPQDFHAGLAAVPMIARHKTIPVVAWTIPADWRWHASDHFNLMEGVYEGPYAKETSTRLVAPNVPISMQRSSMPLEQTLRGIRHVRQVHCIRDARLWIVTDRLLGSGTHAFQQHWHLPLEPGTDIAFTEQEIDVDPAKRRIRTASDRVVRHGQDELPKANVTLHAFSASDLTYRTKAIPAPRSTVPFGQYRVTLAWKASDASVVVTLIEPREPGQKEREDLVATSLSGPDDTVGFEARLPDGRMLRYVAARGIEPVALTLGGVAMTGESLLAIEAGEHVKGLALGCQRMQRHGRDVVVDGHDVEFCFSGPGPVSPEVIPIHRPISPVEIGPDHNVFIDTVDVSMKTTTHGTEIRYTLDGSEPTPQSTRYEGPVRIYTSSIVKARAYRPGLTENPPQNSGTHATATSRAVFNKHIPLRPLAATAVRRSRPGLRARYFEGDWRRLWLRLDSLTAAAEKTGVSAFDLSPVPDTNPPLGLPAAPRAKTFAIEYTGFIAVPETGVYTLHAPREYVMPDIDPGYELRVFLGQHVEPFGYRTQAFGLEQWYPATRLHAQGTWSIPLEKGLHPLRIVYLDYRTDAPAKLNQPDLADYVWSGVTPDLRLSGPALAPQPIPIDWLSHGD